MICRDPKKKAHIKISKIHPFNYIISIYNLFKNLRFVKFYYIINEITIAHMLKIFVMLILIRDSLTALILLTATGLP